MFRNADGKAWTANAVSCRFKRLRKKCGIDACAYKFRHTFATWAIESEAREIDVQFLLGHSTPAMVRRYSSTYNAEKAARAHARWSPGDRLAGSAK